MIFIKKFRATILSFAFHIYHVSSHNINDHVIVLALFLSCTILAPSYLNFSLIINQQWWISHFSLQTYHLLNLSLRATEIFDQYVAFPQSGAGVFVQVGTPELVDYTVTGGKTCQEKYLFHFTFYPPRNQEGNDFR